MAVHLKWSEQLPTWEDINEARFRANFSTNAFQRDLIIGTWDCFSVEVTLNEDEFLAPLRDYARDVDGLCFSEHESALGWANVFRDMGECASTHELRLRTHLLGPLDWNLWSLTGWYPHTASTRWTCGSERLTAPLAGLTPERSGEIFTTEMKARLVVATHALFTGWNPDDVQARTVDARQEDLRQWLEERDIHVREQLRDVDIAGHVHVLGNRLTFISDLSGDQNFSVYTVDSDVHPEALVCGGCGNYTNAVWISGEVPYGWCCGTPRALNPVVVVPFSSDMWQTWSRESHTTYHEHPTMRYENREDWLSNHPVISIVEDRDGIYDLPFYVKPVGPDA